MLCFFGLFGTNKKMNFPDDRFVIKVVSGQLFCA